MTRQEEQLDPEDEADFEREYAKMMADSLESRKFERKPAFDLPLPIRRKDRDGAVTNEHWTDDAEALEQPLQGTMSFSLLTKRGNRQQVSNICDPYHHVADHQDTNCCYAIRLTLCHCAQNPASRGEGGTATNQGLGPWI